MTHPASSGRRRAIEVVDYDPAWPALFGEMQDGLQRLLAGLVLEIHHIGSTAVPGLCAKPKIDVDIVLHSAADIPEGITRMRAAGAYTYHGERYRDGMWVFTTGRGSRGARLYLCAPATPTHLRRILFRDHLRQNADAATAYAALKRRLAAEADDDWDAYTGGKAAFVADVVRQAAVARNQPVPESPARPSNASGYDYDAQYRHLRRTGMPGWAGAQYERALAGVTRTLDRLAEDGTLPPPPARMLELGCGNASAAWVMARKGYAVSGIDIAPAAIGWARHRFTAEGLEGHFHAGTVCAMPIFPEGSFDIVFDGACLHCLIDADRGRCLGEVRRVLRPGGIFVVSSMCGQPRSPESWMRFDPEAQCLLEGGEPYRTLKPLPDLEAELSEAGFRISARTIAENPWWDHATVVCHPWPDGGGEGWA